MNPLALIPAGIALAAKLLSSRASASSPGHAASGRGTGLQGAQRIFPGSPQAIELFGRAAQEAGLPVEWARDGGLHSILSHESGGYVGRPNYSYGERAKNPALWPAVWAELREGVNSTGHSGTGLGQLQLDNVRLYYPHGVGGIGNATEEAIGMLRYIHARYQTPSNAWVFWQAHKWY